MMTPWIDVFGSIADVPAPAWDDVVAGCHAPVFYQRAYLRAYEENPLAQVAAHRYLLGFDRAGDARVAVPAYLLPDADPLGVLRGRLPGFAGNPSGLITHVWHCYDTWLPATQGGQAGVGERARTAIVSAVAGRLRDAARELGAAWYGFANVDAASALAQTLTAVMGQGIPVHERFTRDIRGYTDLGDLLADLAPKPRRNLRRYERRAAEAGAEITICGPDAADLDGLLSLARRTAAKFSSQGFYPEGTFQQFVRRLGAAVRVIEIRLGARLIASGACLIDDRRFHNWTCGVDYTATQAFSPYYLLYCAAVREAIRSGAQVLEGGRANAEFKRRHGLHGRQLAVFLAPC
jgi:predicted N-acyltransferase